MTSAMVTTYTMWALFRNCRKAVEWRYLEQLVPITRDRKLHFGSIIHECLQTWHERRDLERWEGLRATLRDYRERMHTNEPVHTWD